MAQKYNLLVIDDEPDFLDGIKSYFEKREFTVETALDGEAGLAKLRTQQFDVALIDLAMPKLGGIEVIQAIEDESIPVSTVIVTAHGNRDEVVAALKLGAQDWFDKASIDMGQLYQSVKKIAQVIPEEKFEEFMAVLNEKA